MTLVDTCDDLDVTLDRVVWLVEEGDLDGEHALELLDHYRDSVAGEVA